MRPALVQPVWGDVLGAFTAAALRARPQRICLVSPWITETDHGRLRLLAQHVDAHGAELVVVTRPSGSEATRRAMALARSARRHRILTSELLHAKLYVCQEPNGRGVALVGSANMTAGGTRWSEMGVLLRPTAASSLIDDLVRIALCHLGTRPSDTRRSV